MSEEGKDDIDYYGDEYIASHHGTVPGWLKIQYVIWPAWGVIWLMLYWNGSSGYLDRGYWQQLQRAANTTFPIVNQNEIQQTPSK